IHHVVGGSWLYRGARALDPGTCVLSDHAGCLWGTDRICSMGVRCAAGAGSTAAPWTDGIGSHHAAYLFNRRLLFGHGGRLRKSRLDAENPAACRPGLLISTKAVSCLRGTC